MILARGLYRLSPAILLAVAASPAEAKWVAAWTAAPFPETPVLTRDDVRDYRRAHVRQEMTLNGAGTALRVRMTNALGAAALTIAGASVSIGGRVIPLRFAGRRGLALPPGATLTSDPLPTATRRFERIAVSVDYGDTATPAAHLLTVTVRYRDGRNRRGRGPALAAAVEVRRTDGQVLVALGDSITEGARAKPDSFTGWPERFAARLARSPGGGAWTVVNAGIHGNRLLRDGAGPSALARFDRDVLALAGVRAVVLLEGINDIGWGNARPDSDGPVSAQDVIAADRQIVARAQAAGLRIIGATLPPYRGSVYYTDGGEAVRQAVNRWIRSGDAFDAVIDFDRALADRQDPGRLNPTVDSGDHLHPSDNGYAVMAAAIDPRLIVGMQDTGAGS